MRHAIVVIGGDPPDPRVRARLPHPAYVVAADSGFDHAVALGIDVDLLVGDLESLSAAGLARAEALGVPIERHPTEKDATDIELAIDAAVRDGADAVTVVTGGGDRLDHLLVGILLLGHPMLADRPADAWIGPAHLTGLHGPGTVTVSGRPGQLVSLVPIGGDAVGITTVGLAYPLADETLTAATTRGVSNVLLDATATITLTAGSLLVIQPEALA